MIEEEIELIIKNLRIIDFLSLVMLQLEDEVYSLRYHQRNFTEGIYCKKSSQHVYMIDK